MVQQGPTASSIAPQYGPPGAAPNTLPPPQVAPNYTQPRPGDSSPYLNAPPQNGTPWNPPIQQGGASPPQGGYDNPGQITNPGAVPTGPFEEPTIEVPVDVHVQEAQTGRLMMGVGVNSNAGLIGNVTIDEQNFDIRRVPTSWYDIRNATAFRGAGQHFRIEAMPGTVLSRYSVSFTEPYLFDTPISFGLSGSTSTRFYKDWVEKRVGGHVPFGYQLAPDLSAVVAFGAESIRVTNPWCRLR